MSVYQLMAAVLDDELHDFGISSLTRDDCKAIVQSMFERVVRRVETEPSAELEAEIRAHEAHQGQNPAWISE